MRKFLMALFLCLVIGCSDAQEVAVDSKGEPVFQFYSTEDARIQFTRRTPLSGSYLFNSKNKRNAGTLVQLSILNSGDFPLVAKLKDSRPGIGLKLGYQNTIGPFSAIDPSKKGRHGWGINGFFNVDNIKLYDTLEKRAVKKYPLTYGIEGNFTFFFKNKNQNTNWRKALWVYTSISSTWNDHNLLSYQEISKVTIRQDVVAMQDLDGRYGLLGENYFKSRTVISFPVFFKKLNAIPYWAGIFGTQNSPSYHMGVVANLLASSLNRSDTKMPSTFGLGFDWVYATEHLPAKVNVFVKAGVSFGKLRE